MLDVFLHGDDFFLSSLIMNVLLASSSAALKAGGQAQVEAAKTIADLAKVNKFQSVNAWEASDDSTSGPSPSTETDIVTLSINSCEIKQVAHRFTIRNSSCRFFCFAAYGIEFDSFWTRQIQMTRVRVPGALFLMLALSALVKEKTYVYAHAKSLSEST